MTHIDEKLELKTSDVVQIMNFLYAMKCESLVPLQKELEELGYQVEETVHAEDGSFRNLALDDSEYKKRRAALEREPTYLWYAKLREDVLQNKAICSHCNSLISSRGVRSHNHKCPVCGKPTFLELIEGSTVSFVFTESKTHETITMSVKFYDDEKNLLILNREPLETKGLFRVTVERAREILQENRESWFYTSDSCIAIKHDLHKVGVINMCDHSGSQYFHRIVRVYRGRIFKEWDPLPVPDSFHIVEAWRWVPLLRSSTLHEQIIHAAGMVSRCDYYSQDGSTAFFLVHFNRMRLFVDHCTEIPVAKFDEFCRTCRVDGPGFIRDLATFVAGKSAIVRDEPNIANLINGFCKMIDGEILTMGELKAFTKARDDEETLRDFVDIFRRT